MIMNNYLNLNMQQLKVFVAVARILSFSKATRVTNLTQPAISSQIKSLEAQIGKALFSRCGGSKVELTDEGTILLEIVTPLVQGFDSIEARFNEMQGAELKGPLTIATHTSAMMYLLPVVVDTFKKKYPDCALSILNRGRQDILTMLESGEAEVGITSLTNAPPGSIDYEVFARFKRILIAPKGHRLSKKNPITLSDIAACPLLLPPKGSNTRAVVDTALAGNGLVPMIAMELTGGDAAKTYVKMGLGIAILNEFYAAGTDKFFTADVSRHFGYAQRGVLTRKNISRAAEAFKMILLEKYKGAT
jgi:DNA-binding transcriptional LysR family regulator